METISVIIGVTVIIVVLFCIAPLLKGAPWVPTKMKKVRKMLTLAELQQNEVLYDLGCGDGRVLLTAARKFGAKAVGIEISPLFYLWCQIVITIFGLRSRVKIKYGNFFKYDMSEADVVICYLLQETNDKLEDKLLKELKPTARIISNTFMFNKFPLISEDIDIGIFAYRVRVEP
ncbi:MAG: SAM-dependent methyltransferase [Candidatus Thorarchaeota archaeon]